MAAPRRHTQIIYRTDAPRWQPTPPTPSWGWDLKANVAFIQVTPWLAIFPGLAIFVTVLAFNLFGDGLRDALDPRLK
jgi:peptide/nickel transport system permease protein